jgi:hypothetical protein
VSETDPFSDAAFITRLNKLLSMLGSAQPEEADTARRKLIEYLGHYRLSFTDLAQRLRDSGSGDRPSFSQGARELSLERQLTIARTAKQEAVAEANAAIARLHLAETELQQQTFEVGRLLRLQARARAWMVAGWALAAAGVLLAVLPRAAPESTRQIVLRPEPRHEQMSLQAPDPYANSGPLHVGPGEVPGTAAVQDLAIRLTPNDDANVRAFLNRGERLVVQQEVRIGAQNWLLIRTTTGTGWVRAGDVER